LHVRRHVQRRHVGHPCPESKWMLEVDCKPAPFAESAKDAAPAARSRRGDVAEMGSSMLDPYEGGCQQGFERNSKEPGIPGCGEGLTYTCAGRETLRALAESKERPVHEERGANMSDYYLLKTEPSEYSFADLVKDKETEWDGVHNPVALKHLGEMTPGTRLIVYETGEMRTAVGMATVVSVDAKNPKDPVVKIKAGKGLGKPVTLGEIKKNRLFTDSPLVRMGRLSVVPLTAEQYKWLAG
jgi:predicted RNA-binding protein with PUA-like domain